MTRFKGWDEEKIRSLLIKQNPEETPGLDVLIPKTKKKIDSSKGKEKIGVIINALTQVKIEGIETEYRFSKKNARRFDLAIVPIKVAIEYEGGTWNNGGHVRGKIYADNCKKYNEAQIYGWIVLRYTADMCQKKNWEYGVVADVQQIINYKKGVTGL